MAYPYVAKRLLAGDTAEMREKLLKLLLGQEGRSIRERLLLTLVRDDRLNTDDMRSLMELVGRTFAPAADRGADGPAPGQSVAGPQQLSDQSHHGRLS